MNNQTFAKHIIEKAIAQSKYSVVTECVQTIHPDKNINFISYGGEGVRLFKDKNNNVNLLYPKEITVQEGEYLARALATGEIFDDADKVANTATYAMMTTLPKNAMIHQGITPPDKELMPVMQAVVGKLNPDTGFDAWDNANLVNGYAMINDTLHSGETHNALEDITRNYLSLDKEDRIPKELDIHGAKEAIRELENFDDSDLIGDEDCEDLIDWEKDGDEDGCNGCSEGDVEEEENDKSEDDSDEKEDDKESNETEEEVDECVHQEGFFGKKKEKKPEATPPKTLDEWQTQLISTGYNEANVKKLINAYKNDEFIRGVNRSQNTPMPFDKWVDRVSRLHDLDDEEKEMYGNIQLTSLDRMMRNLKECLPDKYGNNEKFLPIIALASKNQDDTFISYSFEDGNVYSGIFKENEKNKEDIICGIDEIVSAVKRYGRKASVKQESYYKPDDYGEYVQEGLFKRQKKLKPIPARDIISYITVEMNAIKDTNDQAMLSGYTCSKLELADFYITCLDTNDDRFIVPHTRQFLVEFQNNLNRLLKQILSIKPVNRNDRVWKIDVNYPDGWRG